MIYIKRLPNYISDGFKIPVGYKQYMVSSQFNFDQLHLQFPRENPPFFPHMDWKLKLRRRCCYNKTTTSQTCYMYFTIQYISIGKQTEFLKKENFLIPKSTFPCLLPHTSLTVSGLKGGVQFPPQSQKITIITTSSHQ